MKTLNLSLMVVLIAALAAGCSERKNDGPVAQNAISVHGAGFADLSSSNHHSKYLQKNNYDIQLCKTCHGSDFSGGTTGQSCNTCHSKTGGPENCTVCHGSVNAAPPKDLSDNSSPTSRAVGAHQKHVLGGILGAAVDCSTCHVVPATIGALGHIDATTHAEVYFDSTSLFYRSTAAYNAVNVSCSNTYCHGNFAGGNGNVTMVWTDTSSTAAQCGTCHGDVTKTTLEDKAFPKTGHPAVGTQKCYQCHYDVVNSSMAIINPAKHINGRID